LAREAVVDEIDALCRQDVYRALAVPPHWRNPSGSVLVLPDESWSRRAPGSLASELANAEPQRAHALCQSFGDGGRARAAGATELDGFGAAFSATAWGIAEAD